MRQGREYSYVWNMFSHALSLFLSVQSLFPGAIQDIVTKHVGPLMSLPFPSKGVTDGAFWFPPFRGQAQNSLLYFADKEGTSMSETMCSNIEHTDQQLS